MTTGAATPVRRGFLRRLLPAQDGTAVMEFGLIAPAFFVLLIGMFDVGHMVYARSVFAGAVERAAREASLETGDTEAADQMVEDMIKPVLPGVELETERTSYYDFADIDRPEKFTDSNSNDTCDDDEPFWDENRSGEWEEDVGVDGNGGAGDVVIYTAHATYTTMFKIPFLPDTWSERTLTATAVKKNQPFTNQIEYAPDTGATDKKCTDPAS